MDVKVSIQKTWQWVKYHSLEKYFIDGKINSTTIEAFLSNKHFSFSDEERTKLMAYVESDPKRIVLA